MRYCNQCHRFTAGEPLYCNFCGSSYGVKLCPARHINPRSAQICSQCGSRDLSTPAPRLSLLLHPLLYGLSLVPGVFLLLISILFLDGVIHILVTNQQIQLQVLLLGLLLGLLWLAYMQLPEFIRKLFRTIWRKPKKDSHTH